MSEYIYDGFLSVLKSKTLIKAFDIIWAPEKAVPA